MVLVSLSTYVMFGFPMTGAAGGLFGFGQVLAQQVEDATTVFQDAFDAFESTPDELRPTPPGLKKSSIEFPAAPTRYEWSTLSPEGRKMIRLVTIESMNSIPSDCKPRECELLETSSAVPLVRCKIHEKDLATLPKDSYEAVSYSWLDMEAEVPLLVNEREELRVNPSLIACLQHLLRKQDKLTLWWDNICVKQTDAREIACQVALMKEIFQGAKRTYLWLGEGDTDSDLALKTLDEICPLDGEGHTSADLRADKARSLVSEGFRDRKSAASLQRTAIAKLLNRKYFERAWIYQEAAASKEIVVLIGKQELNFDRLCDAVEAYCAAEGDKMRRSDISLGNPLQIVAHGCNTLQAIRQGRAELQGNKPLGTNYLQTVLCRVAGSVKARRDHDLVYAFLGFQGGAAPIKIDYEISVGSAYNIAARSLMEQNKTLDLFAICGGQEKLDDLASWAPNWTIRLPQGQPIHQGGIEPLFNASKDMRFRPTSKENDPCQLVTHGKVIDTVAAVSGIEFKYAERNTLGIENFIRLQAHLEFVKKNSKSAVPCNRERVLKVLLAEGAFEYSRHIFDKEPVTPKKPVFDLASLLDAYDKDNMIRQSKGFGLRAEKEAYAKLRKQSLICVRKMMFVGTTGALGLAPAAVKPGDEVAILNGSRVPVVLRKFSGADGHGTTYQLIGQAYFEDAMNGEKVTWSIDNEAGEIVLV